MILATLAAAVLLLAGCGNESADPSTAAIPAGLKLEDLKVGSGPYPLPGQRCTISYTGTLVDGTKFDSSVDRGQDLSFRLGSGDVIRGLDLGVASMKVGGHRKITIPPELGYGSQGSPPAVPPGATLVFDVWLSSVQ